MLTRGKKKHSVSVWTEYESTQILFKLKLVFECAHNYFFNLKLWWAAAGGWRTWWKCGICVAELDDQHNESLTLGAPPPLQCVWPLSQPSGPPEWDERPRTAVKMWELQLVGRRSRRLAEESHRLLLLHPHHPLLPRRVFLWKEYSVSIEIKDQSFNLPQQTMTDSEFLPKNCPSLEILDHKTHYSLSLIWCGAKASVVKDMKEGGKVTRVCQSNIKFVSL